MKYKLIIFDIDGTITRHISSWRFIHERLGLWDALAHKYQEQFLSGKISYRKFCELDAAHWKGMSEKMLYGIFREIKYSKNVKRAVAILRKRGFKFAAISTGLQFVTDRVKRDLGFELVIGNRLDSKRGKLTGGVTINISHGGKGRMVAGMLKEIGIKPSETIAVGDSDGDIPMMRLAGYSIAFNPSSEKVMMAADHVCRTDDFLEVSRKILEVEGICPGKR
ncbi:MAG: HAD family phosphatase [Candidatus Omnitrophica bacterium]|nr:HAD family phosphatase [Candidatus Omnitrophota bacterium]